MTDQTPTQTPDAPEVAEQPARPFNYAEPISAERAADLLAQLERTQREAREQSRNIEKAWASDAAKKIRQIVLDDGNVEWTEFVKHCGGILEVVAMVDDYGLPDTDRIIPKVDSLFDTYVRIERERGSVFVRRPGNRPYVAGRGTSAGEARAAQRRTDRDAGLGDAEALLKQEAEERSTSLRTYRPR